MEITPGQYKILAELVKIYEDKHPVQQSNEPYLKTLMVKTIIKYNPNYGDDRICECGHTYYRHFDSYEEMDPIGCKYCQCFEFTEDLQMTEAVNWWKREGFNGSFEQEALGKKYFPNGFQFSYEKSVLYIYLKEKEINNI